MATQDNQPVENVNAQDLDNYNPEQGNSQVCYIIDPETGDIIISQPSDGMSEIIDLELGGNYVFDFPPANVASLIEQDGNLVIEFTDNSSLVLNNFAAATSGSDAASLTTDSGAVVNTTEFIETMAQIGSQEVAEFLNDPRCEIRKVFAEDNGEVVVQEVAVIQSPKIIESAARDLADISPAAGEGPVDPTAQDLANIEPEAGEGALGATGRGFGFQSSFTPTGVNGLDDTGPIDPTALQYDVPTFEQIEEPLSALTPADPNPIAVSLTPLVLDETDLDNNGTESDSGRFNVDFGTDGPGTFYAANTFGFSGSATNGQLTSCGQPVDVTLVGNQYVGTAVINGVTETIFTLDINADGTYTFNLLGALDHADGTDPNDVINLTFGITAEDNDGDTVDGNIQVQVFDDAPEVQGSQVLSVDETVLDDNGSEDDSGTLTVDFGLDGAGTIVGTGVSTFVAGGSLAGGALTSEGNPVTVTYANGVYTGTANGQPVFTLTINNNGTYTFDLLGTLDHADTTDPDDVINLTFGVTVTDKDGDSVETTITVNVNDDGPVAADDTVSATAGAGDATGNVLANDDAGADDSDVAVLDVTFGGTTVPAGTAIAGQYGTLTINADGSYTYTPNGTNNTNVTDVFTYTMRDADGDTSTAQLTINVAPADDVPVITNIEDLITDETDLDNSGTESDSGVVTADFGNDGPGTFSFNGTFGGDTLTSCGEPVSVALVNGEYVGTAVINGVTETIFTMSIQPNGSYTFNLLGQLDHPDGFDPNDPLDITFGVTATDADGDTANGTINVRVLDDAPFVDNLELSVDETVLDANGSDTDSGTLTFDYGLDEGGSLGPAGQNTFVATGSVAGGQLTSEGNPVTVSLVGNQYIGTANGQTVFTLTINGNGTTTFNLLGTLDHADGTDSNDTINLNFGVLITDKDGDVEGDNIVVRVNDDGPVAVNDTLSTANDTGPATGNVLTNDDAGADDSDVAVLDVTFGGTTVPAGTAIAGQYGTLTINDDGSYSYTPNGTNTSTVTDVFTYTMRDADGDTSTAQLTITVSNDDTPINIVTEDLLTDETDLDNNGTESDSGVVTADFGADGPGTFEATGANTFSVDGGGALTSCGFPVTVSLVNGQYVGTANGQTIFTLDIQPNGSYTFNLLGQLDHPIAGNPNEPIDLNFGVTARDADGDTATGNINVRVLDDAPSVNDITLNVDETDLDDNGTEDDSGTLVFDFGLDDGGTIQATDASTFTSGGSLAGGNLTSDGVPVTVSLVNGQYVGTANGVTVFTLDIDANGVTTFNLLGPLDHADTTDPDDVINLTFGVTITDKDGDTDTATVTVNVRDDGPSVSQPIALCVDETTLDNTGSASDGNSFTADFGLDGAGTIAATGANTFSAGGSLAGGQLTSAGVPVVVALIAGQYVGTANGATIFTLDINPNGTYTFNLFGELDHADTTDPNDLIDLNFGITVTDNDGDSVTETLLVQIHDDGPVAADDVLNVPTGATSGTGNVLANDDAGLDDSDVDVLDVTFGGTTVPAGTSIAGQYGTLVINADGSYTYTPNGNNNGNVTDVFTYTMRDADGDTDTAELRINVGDNNDVPTNIVTENLVTDETDLDDNGTESDSGVVTADFGNDGPGTFHVADASTFSFSGVNSLTSCGFPVDVTVVGNQYIGTANGVDVFTLTINSDGSYTFDLLGQLDHADPNSPNEALFLNFGVIARDADGEEGTGSIRVTVRDDAPSVENLVLNVDETVLDDAGSEDDSGTLVFDFGLDEGGTITGTDASTFTAGGSLAGGALTSEGNPVTVTYVNGVYTGTANGQTVFTLTINPDGTTTFDLLGTLDHADTTDPDDVINLTFGVTVTDKDGDTDTATITVNVNDDGPVAADDTLNVDSAPGTGDVLANDDAGADNSDVAVLDVTFGGNTVPAGTAIAGQYGTLVINADGSYTYTPNGTNVNAVTDVFTYTMRDADGDTDTAQLTINVSADPEPIIINVVDLITDETDLHDNGSESDSGTVTADFGSDGPGTFTGTGANTFSFGGDVAGGTLTSCGEPVTVTYANGQYVGTAVINGVSETVFTLDIQPNGNYTFNLLGSLDHADTNDPNEPILLNFGVTATDNNGDTATANINVTVLDDAPSATHTFCAVDESNFAGTLSVSGTLKQAGGTDFDYGQDGPGGIEGNNNFVASTTPFGAPIGLTSEGNVVNVVWNAGLGQYIGTANGATVFTLSVDDNGDYTYTQFAPIDHPDSGDHNDLVVLSFGIDVTDKDGDSVETTIQVDVYDDGPVATDDALSIPSGAANGTGNVLTNDDAGADDSETAVLDVTFNGNTVPAGTSIVGQYGTLTVNADGSYTYTPLGNNNGNVTDVFTYTMRDADGDTDTAVLRINVGDNDDQPVIISVEDLITDETDLDDNGSESDSGTVTADFGNDGPGTFEANGTVTGDTLTSCGEPVTVSVDANGNYVGTAVINGVTETIFTLNLNETTGSYTFNLLGSLDHPIAGNPNEPLNIGFGVTARDADGDTATGTINVTVLDDAPEATDTYCVVDESSFGNTISVSGTLKQAGGADFDYGLDGPGGIEGNNNFVASTTPFGAPIGLTSAGNAVNVVWNAGLGQYIGTANGATVFTLSVDDNGDYTYTQFAPIDHPDSGDHNDLVVLSFGIDVTDKDGDSVETTIQVDVYDDGPVATDDALSIPSGAANGTGNVLTNDDAGADDSETAVLDVTFNGNTVPAGTSIVGQYGTLVVAADGSYTYTPNGNNNGNVTDVFTYTMRDADGDTDTAELRINVGNNNDLPTIGDASGSVDESNFGGQISTSGTVSFDYGNDGVGEICFDGDFVALDAVGGSPIALTSGGHAVTVTLNANGDYVGTANGQTIFTMTLNGNNGNYQFRMYEPLDHLDPNDPNDSLVLDFGIKILDSDGDIDTGTISINVQDDGPIATITFCIQDENHLGVDINGTLRQPGGADADFGADGGAVLASDTFHATHDLFGAHQTITSGGQPISVSWNGTEYVGTAGGQTVFTLTVRPDGSYTYNQVREIDHDASTGNVIYLSFGVDVVDGDGDTVSTEIMVDVYDSTHSAPFKASSNFSQDADDALASLGGVSADDESGDVAVATDVDDVVDLGSVSALQKSIDGFVAETAADDTVAEDARVNGQENSVGGLSLDKSSLDTLVSDTDTSGQL